MGKLTGKGRLQNTEQILTDIKGEMDSNTIILGGLEHPTYLNGQIVYPDRKLVRRQALNDMIAQIGLIDIYRIFYPSAGEYTFFSSAHRTFSTIHHILDHKSSLGKFKKIEILIKNLSHPQCYEIRNQLQEKNCKTHKCGGKK